MAKNDIGEGVLQAIGIIILIIVVIAFLKALGII